MRTISRRDLLRVEVLPKSTCCIFCLDAVREVIEISADKRSYYLCLNCAQVIGELAEPKELRVRREEASELGRVTAELKEANTIICDLEVKQISLLKKLRQAEERAK